MESPRLLFPPETNQPSSQKENPRYQVFPLLVLFFLLGLVCSLVPYHSFQTLLKRIPLFPSPLHWKATVLPLSPGTTRTAFLIGTVTTFFFFLLNCPLSSVGLEHLVFRLSPTSLPLCLQVNSLVSTPFFSSLIIFFIFLPPLSLKSRPVSSITYPFLNTSHFVHESYRTFPVDAESRFRLPPCPFPLPVTFFLYLPCKI